MHRHTADARRGAKDIVGIAVSQRAAAANQASIDAVGLDTALPLPGNIVVTTEGREAPVATGHNLLTARKLELGTAQGLCSLSSDTISNMARDGTRN